MDNSYTHSDHIYSDGSGCYITAPQLRFFINRKDGRDKFINGSREFRDYFHSCKTYNLISDLMEGDSTCGKMYWDEEFGTVVFAFPVGGLVANKFREVGLLSSDNFNNKNLDDDDLYSI